MLRGTYSQQKEKTREEIWSEARLKAEANYQHPTAEEFVSAVKEGIEQSNIRILKDYVPVQFDSEHDEVYFSREKVPKIGSDEDKVWFVSKTDTISVHRELSIILRSFDLNLGIVDNQDKDNGAVRYDIKIPFITEDERQERIRQETVDKACDMREFKDVDEDDITGECPNDGCDGKRYRNGMGSCGPKYECTRFGCSFKFVRDVL